MSQSENSRIDALIAELRRCAKAAAPDASVTLERGDAQGLADELSRLLQSSHRLRQQNAKLRRRIERLKAGLGDSGPALGDEAEDAGGEGAPDQVLRST